MAINTLAVVAGELVTAAKWNTMRTDLLGLDGNFTGWTAYTPVLSGIGWALGTTGAVAEGVYSVTNGVVHFAARLVFGTGATFGASPNVAKVSLPVTVESSFAATIYRGSIEGQVVDVSPTVTPYQLLGDLESTTIALTCLYSASTYVSYASVVQGAPMTFAVSDYFQIAGWYRKA